MKRKFQLGQILLLLLLMLYPQFAGAEEFCVSNAQNFQDALVKAATNGENDVIKVVKGTYANDHDIFFFRSSEGRNLEVLGGYAIGCTDRTLDPANTIIDGQNSRQALILVNSDGGNIKVEGFTIWNGVSDGSSGGGLYIASHSPTQSGNILVSANIFTNNTATDKGGGLYAVSNANPAGTAGNVTITGNVVTANRAKGNQLASGGGIYAESYSFEGNSGMVTVNGNKVVANRSNFGAGVYALSYGPIGAGKVAVSGNRITDNIGNNGNGGGLYAGSHTVTATSGMVNVANNTISNNVCNGAGKGEGGGVYVYTSSAAPGNAGRITVSGNIIKDNRGGFGGGVYAESSSHTGLAGELDFTDNRISGNQASSGGGGITAMSVTVSGTAADTVLINNILAGNNAGTSQNGSGLWARSFSSSNSGKAGNFTLTHNTITSNRGACGVLLFLEDNNVDIYNNIIRGSLASVPAVIDDISVDGMGILNGFNNNTSGGRTFDWTTSGGNIDQDPFFVSPGHWDDGGTPEDSSDDLWVDGDYHLRVGSPCIDKAHSTPPGMSVSDRDGNQRKVGDNPDMGAYEYTACFPVSPELDISVLCAQYAGFGYAFTLNYYKNPHDPTGFYWELNPETFSQVTPSGPCLTLQQNLKLSVSCAQFLGKPYSFTLDYDKNPMMPSGRFFWKMDVSTIKAKK